MKIRDYFTVFLLIGLLASNTSLGYASEAVYLEEAEILKSINVFKGSEKGFELERERPALKVALCL